MSTIVIGIGNPVLTDDSVGLEVARAIRERLVDDSIAATAELCCGGLRLMEAMAGYDRAIVIDAMVTGRRPGTVRVVGQRDLPETRNTHSTHDGSLAVALELGRMAGLSLPREISLWAIEAGDVTSFGDRLTVPVERAARLVANEVVAQLRGSGQ